MLTEMLKERKLPVLKSREEMLSVLLEEEYGHLPPKPDEISFQVEENVVKRFCAGKAYWHRVTCHCRWGEKTFSFPFQAILPTKEGKYPFFVLINFRADVPDRYFPAEEIIDNGFAAFSLYYHDVTRDNDDFTDGLAGVLYENGKREKNQAGKIAMWSWAAQRVMDYAETLSDRLDFEYAAVCGHSRLGKTALLTAATDPRFTVAYSNDSGCSGAALSRGKTGETVDKICQRFPYWFCENYDAYRNAEEEMPFDQHYLLASIAPRKVLVGSASDDAWADPVSEQLACVAASEAFEKPFSGMGRPAEVGEAFFDGDIAYHLREGSHYFSREDWLRLIEFITLKRKGK